ncbi:MAG: class I SAM-dependent methyltransferase [Gammaproteobacteria bacterium]
MSEVRHGIRNILASHFFYDLFQTIVGANRWRRLFLESHLLGKIPENGTVLDVGCGTCRALSILPPTVNYIGIDRNESYINQAKKRYHDRKATFLCEELSTNLPSFVEKVDAVIMLGILHHLNDEECAAIFSVSSRILNPGGFLLTLDPAYVDEQSKLAKFVVSRDRGTAIREVDGYAKIAKQYFSRVETRLDLRPILIPYTGVTMRCAF